MNIEQLEKNYESARVKGDWADTVLKAVAYANACQQVRKFDAAIACLTKLLSSVENQKSLKAVVLTALGTAYWEKAQLQKALNNFEEALPLFRKAGDKAGVWAILSIVGITYWRKCEWDRALEIMEDALNQKTDRDERFASVYGAFNRGFATLQNRIRLGRELEKPIKILQPLFSSTALHLIEGNMEAFQTCHDEAVALAKQNDQRDILSAAVKIAKLASKV